MIQLVGDLELPGHPPEHCSWTRLRQTEQGRDVGGLQVSGPSNANGTPLARLLYEAAYVLAFEILREPFLFTHRDR